MIFILWDVTPGGGGGGGGVKERKKNKSRMSPLPIENR